MPREYLYSKCDCGIHLALANDEINIQDSFSPFSVDRSIELLV
jgi:hypothetical protein